MHQSFRLARGRRLLCVACGADGARPAWRSTELSPAAGVRGWLGRAPRGDTGEVRGGAGGWARVKSGFIFPILSPLGEQTEVLR
jgi:hypothetical protein